MMWSSASIPGSPRLLIVNATGNIQGWEHEFSDRLSSSLERSGITNEVLRTHDPSKLTEYEFNVLLLFAHPEGLRKFWEDVRSNLELTSTLVAILSAPDFDRNVSEDILKSTDAPILLGVAPLSAMSAREAGLFYLKFFTELNLHSPGQITGKMVWFSFSKARELLRRRRYDAKFGARC